MASLREQVREKLLHFWGKDFKEYSPKYNYYVKCLDDNIIGAPMPKEHKAMFKNGSGSELEDKKTPAKAKAIDSSSMLSYNFFRNINRQCTVTIDNVEYDKVFFEVKLRTLQTRSNPANIDVALISKDKKNILFIESKFLEYLENGAAYFSESYTKDNYNLYYYRDNIERESLHKMSKEFKNEPKHYNYGIKQNICHLIGISNLKNSEDARDWFNKTYNKDEYKDVYTTSDIDVFLNPKTTFRFMNLIFCPNDKDAEKAYKKYTDALMDFLKNKEKLPETIRKNYIGTTFIMTYKELFDNLPEELNVKNELKERYIKYHSEENLP